MKNINKLKRKVFIITSRDIFNHGGERNLMESKALALEEEGWESIYVSARLKGSVKFIPKDLTLNIKINQSFVWAILFIYRIKSLIKQEKPDVVQFSGIWSYLIYPFLAYFLRKNRSLISLDYQGALEELIEFDSGVVRLFKLCLFHFLMKFEKRLYKHSDVIEIVSDNCKIHLFDAYGHTSATFVKVPCLINEPFDEETYHRNREFWRSKLGIPCDQVALVYAGGVSKWQCIDDTINLFNKLDSKCFIFTNESNFNQIVPRILDHIQIMQLNPKEMKEALCAFDYGLLPRDKNDTNFVAFPNKFSEYYNARLTILTKSDAIGFFDDYSSICRKINFKNKQLPVQSKVTDFDMDKISYLIPISQLAKTYEITPNSDAYIGSTFIS